jgi:predicted DNA-binding transcriptional regulator AlpA
MNSPTNQFELRDRYLGTNEAARFTGHSIVQWRKLVKTGRVPRPVRIGERKLLWRLSTLSDFMTALEIEQGVRTAPPPNRKKSGPPRGISESGP